MVSSPDDLVDALLPLIAGKAVGQSSVHEHGRVTAVVLDVQDDLVHPCAEAASDPRQTGEERMRTLRG